MDAGHDERGRQVRAWLLIGVLAALVFAGPARAGDIRCPAKDGHPRGTVLVFHAGGFVYGNASSAAGYCQEFADAGYDSVSVDYPTYDYPGALRYSRRAAAAARKSGLPTYAVGWSAGGTFAAMLAALRDVNAGVAISAPSDLLRWNGKNRHYYRDMLKLRTLEARRQGSPYYRYRPGRSCPLLLMHGRPPDRIVHYWLSVRFARKDHLKLITLKHGHLQDPSSGPRAVHWIERAPGSGCQLRALPGSG